MMPSYTLAFLNSLAGPDMLVLLLLGLLLFGRRLPEMGKNIGKTIVEFKKGLNAAGEESTAPPAAAPPEDENQYRKVITTTTKPTRSVKMLTQTSDEP